MPCGTPGPLKVPSALLAEASQQLELSLPSSVLSHLHRTYRGTWRRSPATDQAPVPYAGKGTASSGSSHAPAHSRYPLPPHLPRSTVSWLALRLPAPHPGRTRRQGSPDGKGSGLGPSGTDTPHKHLLQGRGRPGVRPAGGLAPPLCHAPLHHPELAGVRRGPALQTLQWAQGEGRAGWGSGGCGVEATRPGTPPPHTRFSAAASSASSSPRGCSRNLMTLTRLSGASLQLSVGLLCCPTSSERGSRDQKPVRDLGLARGHVRPWPHPAADSNLPRLGGGCWGSR